MAASWLNDAIFYEIYPQSFYDSNGDGIGDLNGITEKLSYIKDMGCNALWLNPIYDSSFRGVRFFSFCVADNAVPHFISEVKSLAVTLKNIRNAETLLIVVEGAGEIPKRPFSGVAEGGMAQIVAQGDGLGEILIEPQSPGDGAGYAGHFQRMGQAGAVMVTLRMQKYLGLMAQPAESLGVGHPIHIPLEAGADLIFRFQYAAASGAGG